MTAPRYLLDRSIVIHVWSGLYTALRSHSDPLVPGWAATFAAARGDSDFSNTRSARQEDALQRLGTLLEPIPGLPLRHNAAEHYGRIRNELSPRGTPIGANELSLSGHVRASRLSLVTNNVREFERVNEVKVQNWTK